MEPHENFGAYLKSAREKKGIRLEEIASITKINLRSLEHLEAGQWKNLPPDPFLRGFIVAYAKYVGLDAREAVNRFLAEIHPNQAPIGSGSENSPSENSIAPAKPEPAEKTMIPPGEIRESTKTVPFKKIFIGTGAVAVVLLFFVIMRVGQKASEPQPESGVVAQVENPTAPVAAAPPIPASEIPVLPSAETKTEPTKAAAVPPSPEEPKRITAAAPNAKTDGKVDAKTETSPTTVAATPPADVAHEVVIEGKERTWIKVVFDKEAPVEYFLPEGEKVTYRAKEKLKVVLGNSTGTKVIHNGTETKGTKLQGTIRQYLFPDNARFPQDAASRRAASSKVVDGEKPAAPAAPIATPAPVREAQEPVRADD